MNYQEISSALAHIYLEDSYVLSIAATPGRVTFAMEFVLLPGHDLYSAPANGQRYHYQRGQIVFSSVKNVIWSGQGVPPSIDPTDGSEDFGNIDSMLAENSTYFLEGDWGQMQIMSPVRPEVIVERTEM